MIPHTLTDEWGHNAYRVVALNFDTRRMVVECGDSVTSWRVGFELRHEHGRDDWHRFDPGQTWHDSPGRVCRDGGRALGQCLDYDRFLIRPNGPGVGPLRAWLLEQVEAVKTDQARTAAEAKAIVPAGLGGKYTSEQQDQLAALRYDEHLPVSLAVLANSGLRPVADWLLQLRQRGMMHGDDLRQLFDTHRHAPLGPADVDSRVNTLMALGLVKPYDYAPRPGTLVGETEGQLGKAEQLAWRKHGRLPSGVPGTVDRAPKLFGAQFWYFSATDKLRRLHGMPEWSL